MYRAKSTIFLLISLLLFSPTLWAAEANQERIIEIKDYELNGEKEELKIDLDEFDFDVDEFKSNIDFRFNIGPQLTLLKLDLGDLNDSLEDKEPNYSPVEEDLLLVGRSMVIGKRKGSRFGYYRLSGDSVSTSAEGEVVSLGVAHSGFLYENAIYTAERTDLALGVVLGRGNSTLEIIPDNNKSFAEPASFYVDKSFFVIQPHLSLHRQLSSLVGLNLAAAYLWTHSSGWERGGAKIDVPVDDFRAPVFNLRFTFGF